MKLQDSRSYHELQEIRHQQVSRQTRLHEDRITELEGDGREFCEAYIRYNALRTYLSTFVEGMKNNVDEDNFIHPEFMQCVTATGRLSSRNPNFQNMPRGSTFAIRKVVESRYPNGSILEGDYSQLEFRVAGFLANDTQVFQDVLDGTDVHSYTASIIGCSRQDAKAHTFKPLYGGVSGTRSQQAYYQRFKEKYVQVTEWHKNLEKEAVTTKIIKLPSGREYCFPMLNGLSGVLQLTVLLYATIQFKDLQLPTCYLLR